MSEADVTSTDLIDYRRISSMNRRYIKFLFVLLVGYVIFGRGFSYVGVAPIYIGEVCLFTGVVVAWRTGIMAQVWRDRTLIAIAVFMGWGALRTLPYVPEYGLLALRDAVVWGYGVFAFLAASCMLADSDQPRLFVRGIEKFALIFVPAFPLLFVLSQFFEPSIPLWPDSGVPIIATNPGAVLVSFALIVGGLLGGLITLPRFYGTALTTFVIVAAARARGGMLGFVGAMTLLGFLGPVRRLLLNGLLGIMVVFGILWVSNASIELTNSRVLSATTLVEGFTSAVKLSSNDQAIRMAAAGQVAQGKRMDDSVVWRLIWWKYLMDYVNARAPVTGIGFGMSLALKDLPTHVKDDVRSPHNINMTIFARLGLIGLSLWFVMLITWFQAMLSAYWAAVKGAKYIWASIFMTVPATVLALVLSASFDLYIEAPTGGITFWTLLGLGAGLRRWFLAVPDYWSGGLSDP